MLKFPCLVLDHDDTVVRSEEMINFPYFQYILNVFRPGTSVTKEQYTWGCYHLGFADMCRQWYGFSEQELVDEYLGWKEYIMSHVPEPFAGVGEIIARQRAEGGRICVVSHSSRDNILRDYRQHFGMEPDDIFGWDLPEHQRKPSVYPLQQIMAKYGYKPEELLVVDDMKPAWQMAKGAGVKIAFAQWGRTDCPELGQEMRQLCDYSFDSPEKLGNFLFDALTGVL